MEQAIVARPRTGWNSAEEELLQRAVDRCRAAGEPLKTAFTEAARETGRRPNSVRNHYYASGRASVSSPAFLPFSQIDLRPVKDLDALIDGARIGKTVLYMDYGSREMRRIKTKQLFGDTTARLVAKGVQLTSRVVPGGNHSEESWERQIPFFLSAILYDL